MMPASLSRKMRVLELWVLPEDEEAADKRGELAEGHRGGGEEEERETGREN